MINIKTKVTGTLTPEGYIKYSNGVADKVKNAFNQALKKGTDDVKGQIRNESLSAFKTRKAGFQNTFRVFIYDKKKDKFNSAIFYNKMPFFHIFETGGSITGRKGKILIPFNYVTRGRGAWKSFKDKIQKMHEQKKTFVKNVHGKLILFLKIDKENSRMFTKVKKGYRAHAGVNKVGYGTILPIGVIVSNVYLKSRFQYEDKVQSKAGAKVSQYFDEILKFDN